MELTEEQKKWALHSGEDCYPVPGGVKAYVTRMERHSLWQGRQLEYRLSLIRYMIEKLEKELDQ